ncbi:MAG: tetratricopeptide repeat protein [Deltaproteobacteria bacterium]|nr:tetratricopeptide repeat protein [Deltaproteobacteria bacterium]
MYKKHFAIEIIMCILLIPSVVFADNMINRMDEFHKAEVMYKVGNTNMAVDVLKNLLKHDNTFTLAYIDIVKWLTETGAFKQAISYGEAGLKATNGNPYVVMELANAYEKDGDVQQTITLIQGLNEKYFKYKSMLENIADAYQQIGLSELGLSILKELQSRYPDDPYIYNKLGILYYKLGRKDLALESFSKAAKIQQDDPVVLNNIGIIYSDGGDYKYAISYYSKAILRKPNCAYCYLNLGVAYRFMNNYNDALYAYKKSIEIDPGLKEAYYDLSVLEQGYLKNYPEAIKYLEKYRSLLPGNDKRNIEVEKQIKNLKNAISVTFTTTSNGAKQ